MNHYIIVIEVDNVRAFNAYSAGMQRLALVWDQILFGAGKIDQIRMGEYEAKLENYRKAVEFFEEKQRKQEADYRADYARWEAEKADWQNRWFRGDDEPRPPMLPYCLLSGSYPSAPHPPGLVVDHYKSIRAELAAKAGLAGAAVAPFKMPEYEVAKMLAWADGTKVHQLLEDLAGAVERTEQAAGGAI